MRRFLTIGLKPDGKISVLENVESGKSDHITRFNEHAAAKKKKSDFVEVQVIDLSRGVIKRKRFGAFDSDGKRTIARSVKPKKRTTARTAKGKKPAAKKTSAKKAAPKRVARTSKPKAENKSSAPTASAPAPSETTSAPAE